MARDKRFEVIEKESMGFVGHIRVIVDTETGVNYPYVQDGYGGGVTTLVDAKGNPIVTR